MAQITTPYTARSLDAEVIPKQKNRLWRRIVRNWDIYVLISIPLLVLLIYSYVPMLGIIIAFKNYRVFDGILDSKWVGLAHFRTLLSDPKFFSVLSNTLLINLFKFLFQFPLPIILALLLNEVRKGFVKRLTQTLTYLPHFLSWVVIAGIFVDILSPSTGVVNTVIKAAGFSPITFLGDDSYFRSVLVASTAWKETGWSAIIYLAALTSIDPDLYAASSVDGAGKWRQTWHITLPGISSTIVFIIILRVSSLLGSDTEQVLLLYNPLVYGVGDIIGTYVYREGIQNGSYSYTTAVGLFISSIGFTLMIIANKVSRKYSDRGIW
ncbi:ABC transporter permease [Paenibacillus whitsoniae]|uniref:Sugar ABC transporter permease n=1 Tax=Paenibacillus whitsoniae TaxID=2496558 RepID=A0A3S0ANX3_9BACL|nr:ABC transporter permease subunit [Paenibacillus whitsoniae]RTE08791.1 sugar ABC transporter permease [Paenibacillus whitsoniae]